MDERTYSVPHKIKLKFSRPVKALDLTMNLRLDVAGANIGVSVETAKVAVTPAEAAPPMPVQVQIVSMPSRATTTRADVKRNGFGEITETETRTVEADLG